MCFRVHGRERYEWKATACVCLWVAETTLVNETRCIVMWLGIFLQEVMTTLCVAVAFILSKHKPGVYKEGHGEEQWAECGFPDPAG